MRVKALALFFCFSTLFIKAQVVVDTAYYEDALQQLDEALNKSAQPLEFLGKYQKIMEEATAQNLPKVALDAALGIAEAHCDAGDLEKAKQLADSIWQAAKALRSKRIQAQALASMGRFSWDMIHLYAAISEFGEAERIYLQLSDKTGLANVYQCLGSIHFDLDDFEASRTYDLKAMELSKRIGDMSDYLSHYYNYGYSLAREGNTEEAFSIFDEIAENLEEIEEGEALSLLCSLQLARLEYGPLESSVLDKILKNLRHIEENKEKLPQDYYDLCFLYYGFAQYYLVTKKPNMALGYIKNSDLESKNKDPELRKKILLLRHRYHELMGNKDSALVLYQKYQKMKVATMRDKEHMKIKALKLKHEREKRAHEIASKELRTQLIERQAERQRLFSIFLLTVVSVLGLGALAFYLQRKKRVLKKAREGALQGVKTKSLFLDTITHKLRTPIDTILGGAYLLKAEKNEESRSGLLQVIRSSSEYLNKLIENITLLKTLEEAKGTKKEGERTWERFNFGELVAGMHGVLAHSKNNNRLEIRVDQNIPKFLIGPELDLSRVLINLLSNSDKFTTNGLIKISAQKNIARVKDHVALTITVSDNGSGIRDDEKEKVFEAFYSGKAHRSEQYMGMGLGLNLVKRLLEKHGARPRLESWYGIGTSISFTLEFGIPKEQNDDITDQIAQAEKAQQSILLVEDNEVSRDIIKQIIKGLGYHCDVADNGKNAVEKYKALPYSLVFMDMMMPLMDGSEAILLIKEYDPKAIIVALTAVSKEKYGDLFHELDIAAVISKPVDSKTIQAVLKEQLHGHSHALLTS